jgi:membrane associated rhomboid family serine protease
MKKNNFIDEIKRQYQSGGMHVRLIFINAIVFIGLGILEVFARLIERGGDQSIRYFINGIFSLQSGFGDFITHPWGIFTYMFTHNSFWHFAMNMLFLFFAGQMFLQFFSARRMLYTYILGGLAGGILEILSTLLFPNAIQGHMVVGASGSIMALFIALAFYRPQLQVNLFGILPVRLYLLAALFLLQDFLSLGNADSTAHFAHLGGALMGALTVQNPFSPKNIVERSIKVGQKIENFWTDLFAKNKMTVVSRNPKRRPKSDEQYNAEQKQKQEIINEILDKISQSGYDSLSKKEKEILFKQSQE